MRETRTAAALAAVVLGLAVVAGSAGCTSATAEPIEVTYYYLPG